MAAHQVPLSLGLSRQEHWSGLPFPSPLHESEKWKWSRSSCLTFPDPMDCSPPGSSVHGIFQARVLEWAPLPSPNTIFRGVLTPEGCNAQMKGVGVRRNIIQSIATCISKQSQTKLLCNANGSLHTPSSKWRSPKYECESLGSTCLLILSVLVFFFFFFPLPLYIHFKIFIFWSLPAACGTLVPWPGIKLAPLAVETRSQPLNHQESTPVLKYCCKAEPLPSSLSEEHSGPF